VVIKEFFLGLRLFVSLSACVIGLNIINDSYVVQETEFINKYLQPNMTVLNIGTNIGYFSTIMATVVGLAGIVYTFELLGRNATLLEPAIKENGFEDNVERRFRKSSCWADLWEYGVAL
jgi:protein-L-isoaspartate O-methyltransferase